MTQQTFVLMKTSFVFVFRRCLQDVLIKTDKFTLLIRLQRRLQDVFIKSNIFVLVKRLQDVFKDVLKTFSRRTIKINCSSYRVFKMSSRRIQNVSETFSKDGYLWKELPRSHFWEIYVQCTKCARVKKVSQILVSHFTTPFSSFLQRRIYNLVEHHNGPFFAKILNGFKLLTIFDWV